MQLIEKVPATIYVFVNEDGDIYSFECREGVVVRISKEEIVYCDDGDFENGPAIACGLSDPQELNFNIPILECNLITDIEVIVKDVESYTLHRMMMNADYSNF
jgi:hypothetical protein